MTRLITYSKKGFKRLIFHIDKHVGYDVKVLESFPLYNFHTAFLRLCPKTVLECFERVSFLKNLHQLLFFYILETKSSVRKLPVIDYTIPWFAITIALLVPQRIFCSAVYTTD